MKQEVLSEMHEIVDRCIQADDLNELMKSFISARAEEGSSVWAAMTESTHRMLGGQSPYMIRAAALTELLMLTLDIVDDLQDRDKNYRLWMKCPEPVTLNAVLGFLMAFMGEIGQLQLHIHPAAPLLAIEVSQLVNASVNGQQKDLNPLAHIHDETEYFSMVQLKSGSLIRLAFYMGYSLVEALSEEMKELFNEIAYCLGVIAQIENDVSNLERLGPRNDLLQRKKTLPILYLLSHEQDRFPELIQYYEGALSEEAFIQHKQACLDVIAHSGCLEYARIIQSLYIDRAEQLFERIPGEPGWRTHFRQATLDRFGASRVGNNG